ncbi:hypothetical protein [Teredinibacter turnerae]|uniref:hypothetical protein n=1 Tax=Teredinibacter turnerae TaxID=2426 RepID=UPI0012BBA0E0|nr:hypothetical protein [Teredinibacter turnerae]
MFTRIILVLSCCTVAGCVSNFPNDLKIVEIEEIHSDTKNFDLPDDMGSALKVEFSTRQDLNSYISDNSFNMASTAYFCNRPEMSAVISLPKVYFLGKSNEEGEDRYFYESYWRIEWSRSLEVPNALKKAKDQSHYILYDLSVDPEDICLQVKGGNVTGRGFQSNVVTVSKDKLVKAISK